MHSGLQNRKFSGQHRGGMPIYLTNIMVAWHLQKPYLFEGRERDGSPVRPPDNKFVLGRPCGVEELAT